MHTLSIQEAKQRLPLRALMRKLGVLAESIPERDGQTAKCPWRDHHKNGDRNPSFNIFEGGSRYNCFACNESGDGPDFVAMWCGLSAPEGRKQFVEMAGSAPAFQAPPMKDRRKLVLPATRRLTEDELQVIAGNRCLSLAALSCAQSMGTLRAATVCGFPCWILTDSAGMIAEARRVDGKPFPAFGDLGERKAHTLAGSNKSWPVGVAVLHKLPPFRAVMLVEGGPDYLAALHFCLARDTHDVLPVAMLGRGAGTRLDAGALALLQGRPVRIYAHNDPDGGGMASAKIWAGQFHGQGCPVDIYPFTGLSRSDGEPVKDLNDCALIAPADEPELSDLLP